MEDIWSNELAYLFALPDLNQSIKYYNWIKIFPTQNINAKFPELGDIKQIRIEKTYSYQSVKVLKILGDNCQIVFIGEKIRTVLKLKSVRCE